MNDEIPTKADHSPYDVVVVGGGAAGLSAALVLARARRKVLVVDAGEPAVAADDAETFSVALAGGGRRQARRVLVTTGLRDELPDVPGLRERWAHDVLHCPYCHGYEVQDRRLGVLGGTPGSVRYAQIVRQWSDDLDYFTPPDTLDPTERRELTARGIGIIEGHVERLVVDDVLRGVQMGDGHFVARDALFVPPRFAPNDSLLVDLGCDIDDGWVRADPTGRTSTPGVWVAGNVVDPRAQVISAAGAGSAAAIAINADLVDEDVRTAVRATQKEN